MSTGSAHLLCSDWDGLSIILWSAVESTNRSEARGIKTDVHSPDIVNTQGMILYFWNLDWNPVWAAEQRQAVEGNTPFSDIQDS